jgi:hypothetical protein
MNSIFNFHRFYYVLRKTILERPIQLFGLTLVILGLVFLIYLTSRDIMGYSNTQDITFFIGLVGGGFFLSSAVFGHFTTYSRGASFLCLPASNFEKWLAGIMVVFVLFLPLFLVFFSIMDSTLVEIYRNNLDPKASNYEKLMDDAKVLNLFSLNILIIYKLFFNISAIMLVGSLYFNKMGVIKVGLLVCALLFLSIGLNYLIANSYFGEDIITLPFYYVSIKTEEIRQTIELPPYAQNLVNGLFLVILPSLLLTISFIRFKEKEF